MAMTTTATANITKDRSTCLLHEAASVPTEELAFVYWQYHANEKAFENNLITKVMYEFAKDELRKIIDRLSEARFIVNESRLAVRQTAPDCSPMHPR